MGPVKLLPLSMVGSKVLPPIPLHSLFVLLMGGRQCITGECIRNRQPQHLNGKFGKGSRRASHLSPQRPHQIPLGNRYRLQQKISSPHKNPHDTTIILSTTRDVLYPTPSPPPTGRCWGAPSSWLSGRQWCWRRVDDGESGHKVLLGVESGYADSGGGMHIRLMSLWGGGIMLNVLGFIYG